MWRVPKMVLDSVCFLSVKAEDESGREYHHYIGTAFFVEMEEDDLSFSYLVTARHVLKDEDEVYVRLNKHDGSSEVTLLPTEWVYHQNPAVDVAVLPYSPPLNVFRIFHVHVCSFARREPRYPTIGVGDDLLIAGLFSHRWGHQRNIPIVRAGIIAAMPEEPFPFWLTEQEVHYYDAYLVEIRSIGGLSGSPVFVVKDAFPRLMTVGESKQPEKLTEYVNRALGVGTSTALLGLVRGHWDLERQANLSDPEAEEIERFNTGIAQITPAWNVLEVLEEDTLRKGRTREKRKH